MPRLAVQNSEFRILNTKQRTLIMSIQEVENSEYEIANSNNRIKEQNTKVSKL